MLRIAEISFEAHLDEPVNLTRFEGHEIVVMGDRMCVTLKEDVFQENARSCDESSQPLIPGKAFSSQRPPKTSLLL